jgi:transposase
VEYIGVDVHKRDSQVCILAENGDILERRIRTEASRFAALFGERPRARILLEASTESEWVARCLEALGHEVIVGDPNYAPMYAQRSRRVKTDRRDARTLAEACRVGAYRPSHRASDEARQLRMALVVRDAVVRTRVRYINVIRAMLRQEGLRVGSGSPAGFRRRLAAVALPEALAAAIKPLVALLAQLDEQIATTDKDVAACVGRDPAVRRLCTVPGVGPVTAVAYVAALDQPHRFPDARRVAAYLGLVPRESSSGEQRRRGPITKAGNTRVRWLLVEAAWTILRTRTPCTEPLRVWAERLTRRRGKAIAAVALARRLARLLYAMWRDGTDYQPGRLHSRPGRLAVI